MAAKDRSLYSKLNRGEPGIAATSRAGAFVGRDITRSSELGEDEHSTTDSNINR
jgi:hypothetical protein